MRNQRLALQRLTAMTDGETLSAVRTGGARSCAAVTSAALAERMAELGMLHAASCMLCVACCALHGVLGFALQRPLHII